VTDFEALLEAIRARPASAAKLLAKTPHRPEFHSDERFVEALLPALSDAAALRALPSLPSYFGKQRYAPAVPGLVDVWRTMPGTPAAANAGHALLAIGSREGLEALRHDVSSRIGDELHVALKAAFAGDDAFDRIAAGCGPHALAQALWLLASATDRPVDPRWMDLAIERLASTERGVAEAARDLLRARASEDVRSRLLAREGARIGSHRPSNERALASARAQMAKLASKLSPSVFVRGRGAHDDRIAELADRIGGIPASVAAFYELIDGIDVPAEKPRDRFVVFGLEVALDAARAWTAKYTPKHTARSLVPPFLFPVAPDGATKSGLSGGPPLGFEAPTDDDDPVLSNAKGSPSFSTFVKRAARAARS
jgi:hypothetical protein